MSSLQAAAGRGAGRWRVAIGPVGKALLGILIGVPVGLAVGVNQALLILASGVYWGVDFSQYWTGAISVATGRHVYYWLPGPPIDVAISYPYPPFLAVLLSPLTRFWDSQTARGFWLVFSILCLVLGCYITARLTTVPGQRINGALWLSVLLILPATTWALGLGQISPQLLLIAVGALGLLWSRWPALSGTVMAIGLGIKLFPALLIGYLVARREWRAALLAVGTAGLLVGLTLLVLGGEIYHTYLTQVVPSQRWWLRWPYNVSVAGFFIRLETGPVFSRDPNAYAPFPVLPIAISSLFLVGVCAYGVWRAPAGRAGALAAYSLAIVTMLLTSPMNGNYNILILLLPLTVVLREWASATWWYRAGAYLAVLLLSLPVQLCGDGDWILWTCTLLDGPLAGHFLLFALLLYLCFRRAPRGEDQGRLAEGSQPVASALAPHSTVALVTSGNRRIAATAPCLATRSGWGTRRLSRGGEASRAATG